MEVAYKEPKNIDNLSVAQLKDLKEKRSRDVTALGLIQRGVDDPIFSRIMRASKAKQTWKTLQNEYKGDVKVRAIIQSLRRQLEKIKMEKNEVVDEFTNRIIKVMNQMKSYGEEISDKKEVIEKMLISLLKKFDLIMAIK